MTKRKQPEVFDLLFWLHNKEISLAQFRAQMKDIGKTDEDIEAYLDGDAANMDEEQLYDR
ncbi:hypothetical protein [Bradyrhizobium sp. Leo121]|uniref:hypothetical protein n=1 Tax=Bradyrhizobium sp. Leo121 TaxID=1571195 RepID=UPI00102A09A8|nr:hypothetical protein [Bradyrhizobium sp. Leo121]RZN19499.1 hypothetical protein CWO90_35300 [Bradyrhizobium sp. Leo121]